MKNKFLFFIFVFSFLLIGYPVNAQEMLTNEATDSATTIAKMSQVRKCLVPTIIGSNKVSLTGNEMPVGEKIYIVDCVPTANNFVCTTGNSTWDDLLGITASNPPSFSVDQGNPFILKSGTLNLTATVELGNGATHYFIATILIDTSTPEASSKSIKLGTFNFNDQDLSKCVGATEIANVSDAGGGGDAGGSSGDPYGRIFDAKSLEPISNVSISILDKNKNFINKTMLVNPQVVKNDGVFNFVVEPGTYYLNPTIPSGYTFASISNINPNYTKAYSEILTSPNEAVIEKSIRDPEHRDIALDPGNNTPFRSTPTKINYGTMKNNTNMVIIGRVSHPFSIIEFVQGSKIIGKTTATKYGSFKVTIKNTVIQPDEAIDVSITKVDLTKSNNVTMEKKDFFMDICAYLKSMINPTVQAATVMNKSTFTIEPIPSYLEGLAYDKSSTPVPNATIYIKLRNSNQVYYETKADEKGAFKIEPANLPNFAYSIEIKNPKTNVTTKQTTYDFALKNKQYLTENKINLMTAVKNGKSLIKKTQTTSPNNVANKTTTAKKKMSPMEDPNSIIFTLLVLFVIMLIIGVTLYFLYKNNTHNKDDRILF